MVEVDFIEICVDLHVENKSYALIIMASESKISKVNNILNFCRHEVKFRGFGCEEHKCELKFDADDYVNEKHKSQKILKSILILENHIECEFRHCNYNIDNIQSQLLGSLLEKGVQVVKKMVGAITITTLKLNSILKLQFRSFQYTQVIFDTALEAWKSTLNSYMGAVVSIMWGVVKIKYVSAFEEWHKEINKIIYGGKNYVDDSLLEKVSLTNYFLKEEDKEWLNMWFGSWSKSKEETPHD